jgi:hypothetical protein
MTHKVNAEASEMIAIQALSFIAGDSDRLSRFIALSGCDAASIRTAATDSGFLAGVLDYLGADESLLIAFAAEAGLDPATVVSAQSCLSGHGTTEARKRR